jgi:hypothetical protein
MVAWRFQGKEGLRRSRDKTVARISIFDERRMMSDEL